jgi:hypothetical protein
MQGRKHPDIKPESKAIGPCHKDSRSGMCRRPQKNGGSGIMATLDQDVTDYLAKLHADIRGLRFRVMDSDKVEKIRDAIAELLVAESGQHSMCNVCWNLYKIEEAGQEQCSVNCFEKHEAGKEIIREYLENEAIRKQLEENENTHHVTCGCTRCN